MPVSTDAGRWLAEQKEMPVGRKAIWQNGRSRTELGAHNMRKAKKWPSPKAFVENNRHIKTTECVFVPGAVKGKPSRVAYCDRTMAAARYMALLTHGTPKNEGAVARHLCGNGHLSCINPAHIEWGTEADNIADANKHRGCETVQDKIHATAGRK